MKTIVVISSLVDSTVKEYQPDVNFILFRTIEDLGTHITTTPIRAESLFFTRDTIPQVNTSLNYLKSLLENPFITVNTVVYITEKDSKELPSIKYLISTSGYDNWEIVEGYLTREYVSGIINGTLRTDNVGTKRKAVYRVPKEAYVKDKLRNKESLTEEYIADELDLAAIPDEIPPVWIPPDIPTDGEIFHIVGDDIEERTVLAFLVAQYLSLSGKTLIMERDTRYHQLTEYVTKSGIECYSIDIADILNDPQLAVHNIRKSPQQLICVTSIPRLEYSYSFIFNVLYNNLYDSLRFFIQENTFIEAPTSTNFTVALRTTIPGVLHACEELDPSFIHLANFVGVNLQYLAETRIPSGIQLQTLISDVLNTKINPALIVNITSLRIGDKAEYDIRSILGR